MNIIIFSKSENRGDAYGKHGPQLRWYQEEVNTRRRKHDLVSRRQTNPSQWHLKVAPLHIILKYIFGTEFVTACKYSFPREDEGSPRQAILDKFCQDEVKLFRNCMNANNYDENKCLPTKIIVDKCAAAAFKKVNS